jgi:zinc transport system permease protein
MFDLFQYDFLNRAFIAGILIAIIAPLIGIFVVLRRFSLIADTLSHVSLAGVALGLITGINPLFTGMGAAIISALAIEKLRVSKKVYGETALALFLSGGLALAVTLVSFKHGLNANLFSYLFGSIVTVAAKDVLVIAILAAVIMVVIGLLYKELVYMAFDEETAQVNGIPTKWINALFVLLAAVTVALAIPIVGVLLISALMIIPVVTALQLRKSFKKTLLWAEVFSVISVIAGLVASWYLEVSPGGAIVLTALGLFILVSLFTKLKK